MTKRLRVRKLCNGEYIAEFQTGFWVFKHWRIICKDYARIGDIVSDNNDNSSYRLRLSSDYESAIRYSSGSHKLIDDANKYANDYASMHGYIVNYVWS